MSLGVAWAFPGCTLDVTWLRPGFLLGVALGAPPLVVSWLSPGCLLGVHSAFPHETFHSTISNAKSAKRISIARWPQQQGFCSTGFAARISQHCCQSMVTTAWFPQQCFHCKVSKASLQGFQSKSSQAGFPHHGYHNAVFTASFAQPDFYSKVSTGVIA